MNFNEFEVSGARAGGYSPIPACQRYLWSDSESRRAAAEAMFLMLDGSSG